MVRAVIAAVRLSIAVILIVIWHVQPARLMAIVIHLPEGENVETGGWQVNAEGAAAAEQDLSPVSLTGMKSFPWATHVASVGMGSGIYLGDGIVLTSAHVGCYPPQFVDLSYYKPAYRTWTVLKNEDGQLSDLATYRVQVPAGSLLSRLPPLPMTRSTPEPETHVLMWGTGFGQAADPVTVRSNGKVMALLGYQLEPRREIRWGVNRLADAPLDKVATGEFKTHCLMTRFDQSMFEAQAGPGDSGGAVFIHNPDLDRWELAGCIIAASQKGKMVPFGSRTYLADLARYRNQLPFIDQEDTPAMTDQKSLAAADLREESVASLQSGEEAEDSVFARVKALN